MSVSEKRTFMLCVCFKIAHPLPLQEAIVTISVEEDLIPVLAIPSTPSEVLIGNLRTRAHRVSGTVYALGERTIMIEGFNYDGTAPGR